MNEITKNSVKITLGDGTVKELACDTVILGVSMKHNEERLEKMMGIIR